MSLASATASNACITLSVTNFPVFCLTQVLTDLISCQPCLKHFSRKSQAVFHIWKGIIFRLISTALRG